MSTPQEETAIYDFTHLDLGKDDFDNLVFMNPPEEKEWDDSWLKNLCVQPLWKVVEDVIHKSKVQKEDGATQIFEKLDIRAYDSDCKSWFDKHASLSRCFDKRLMPALWIRNLGDWKDLNGKRLGERKDNESSKYTWYIDDGNTRSLVYAVRSVCGEEEFEHVKAIHATSWDFTMGILGHQPQVAEVLEHKGKFQNDVSPGTRIERLIKWNRSTNEYA